MSIVSKQSEPDVFVSLRSAPVRKQAATVSALRVLTADLVIFSHMAQGFHWNVTGRDFTQLHELFSNIYEDVHDSIDMAGENVVKLGGAAPYLLSEFLQIGQVNEPTSQPNEPTGMLTALLKANEEVLATLDMTFKVATAENEQGVANFVADRIDSHKKWSWQLRESI